MGSEDGLWEERTVSGWRLSEGFVDGRVRGWFECFGSKDGGEDCPCMAVSEDGLWVARTTGLGQWGDEERRSVDGRGGGRARS